MHTIIPIACSLPVFEKVKTSIHEMDLDDRDLKAQEFLTLSKNDELLGFCRMREHSGFNELCSFGVVEKARRHGLGQKLVNAVIEASKQPLYLVSIIPNYFQRLGFEICEDFPNELREKLNYCINSLPVPEHYVVMRYVPISWAQFHSISFLLVAIVLNQKGNLGASEQYKA